MAALSTSLILRLTPLSALAAAAHHVLREGARFGDIGHFRGGLAVVRLDRAFGRGTDGELEALQGAVAELDGPHDRVGTTQGLHRAAERHDVGVVAHFDGLLRADLDAAVALPALLRLLVVRLHGVAGGGTVLVGHHQVMRGDVNACGLVLTLAAIALIGTYECWHGCSPLMVNWEL